MHFNSFTGCAALAWLALGQLAAAEVHGEGDEGSIMGPVAFLWPDDRPWNAAYDNTGPCGSASGVSNRTIYPLSQGEVALSIADDAWKVAFYMSFDDDPDTQSDFVEQVVGNVTEILPGHQCYKIASIPSSVTAGTNATIQLEYWSTYGTENDGKNETFFACADITFVNDEDFNLSVPCFNVTAADFTPSVETTTASATSAAATSTSTTAGTDSGAASSSSSSSDGGLSTGAKAGIAVGTIVGSLAIVGLIAFVLLRKRRPDNLGNNMQMQTPKRGAEAASVNSNMRE